MIPLPQITKASTKRFYRVVESQETVATMKIVDTLEEQAQLENIIEASKPPIPVNVDKSDRHYLLKTPFRYPPLKYGSRFGRRFEPSLFYASHNIKSALSESAFYSFYFMSRSNTPFTGIIHNKKTSFAANISSQHHAELCLIDDTSIQQALQHKSDYAYPQKVGSYMRDEGIEAFSYYSARDENGRHVGIFYLGAIKGEPEEERHWEIKQTPEHIMYYCPSDTSLSAEFSKQNFCVNGQLPHPSQ